MLKYIVTNAKNNTVRSACEKPKITLSDSHWESTILHVLEGQVKHKQRKKFACG